VSSPRNEAAKYKDRIVRDRRICGGEAVFKGTRVTLTTVLASLADGDSIEVILRDFPSLAPQDVHAAIAYAAACTVGKLPPRPHFRTFSRNQIYGEPRRMLGARGRA